MDAANELPTYCKFLAVLEPHQLALSRLSKDSRDCTICLEPLENLTKVKFDKKIDWHKRHNPLELPCNHIFGFNCNTSWFRTTNNCPLCRRELFELLDWGYVDEIQLCFNDDMVNLIEIRKLYRRSLNQRKTDGTKTDGTNGNDQPMNSWRDLLYGRAWLFHEGELNIEKSDYAKYTRQLRRFRSRQGLASQKRRRIDANRLYNMIEDDYTTLILREISTDEALSTIVSHPFGYMVLQVMLEVVTETWDDSQVEISAIELRSKFEQAYIHCLDEFIGPERYDFRLGQYTSTMLPDGYSHFVADMFDAAIVNFLALANKRLTVAGRKHTRSGALLD